MVAMSTRNQRASGGGQSTAATSAFRWFAEESSRGTAKLPSLRSERGDESSNDSERSRSSERKYSPPCSRGWSARRV